MTYQSIGSPLLDPVVWDAIYAHPHLGRLVETLDFDWVNNRGPFFAFLPNLKHIKGLVMSDVSQEIQVTDSTRPVLSTLSICPKVGMFNWLWSNDLVDLRHLRRLDIVYNIHKSTPNVESLLPSDMANVESVLPSDGLHLLEVVTITTDGDLRCTRRCTGSDCPSNSSQHVWIDGFYRLVQSHRDRYPLLRFIDLESSQYDDWIVSFETRAGRDGVRLGALAPKLRSVSLTIRDTTGQPWIEEWDAE